MNRPELIIFDMDGLMFDTEMLSFISSKQAVGMYGYDIDSEFYIKTIGSTEERTKEIYYSHFGRKFPAEDVRVERLKIMGDIMGKNGVPVKPGLYELLEYLKILGVKKAVATSTQRERALFMLKSAGVDIYFDYILCGDEISNSKPHPEIFLKAAQKLGCKPEDCVVLEDSEVGIMAAHRAGMLPFMIPDMIMPGEETKRIVYKQLKSLSEFKSYIEDIFNAA